MKTERYTRFKDISIGERILNTVFLLTISLGYFVALANLYYTNQGKDGKAGLSIEDIVISYHGSNNQTRLGTAINGIMEPNLKFKSDKDIILAWIQAGADEKPYEEKIAPLLNRDCIGCHTPAINPSLPDLTNYSGVSAVAHAGGATIPFLIRVLIFIYSVSHLFSFLLAKYFCFLTSMFMLKESPLLYLLPPCF